MPRSPEAFGTPGTRSSCPRNRNPAKIAAGIFATDVRGIDWAEALVAIMDGPDPDSGTAWECGYAYGKKPVILVRTDIREQAGRSGVYNAMLTGSATERLDLPGAAMPDLIRAVLRSLANVEGLANQPSLRPNPRSEGVRD